MAMHTAVGGLAGGTPGALGAGAASAAAPQIEVLQDQLKTALKDAGVNDSTANVIAGLVGSTTAATMGTVASGGSTAGAATAFNADLNNRQLHPSERRKAAELAAKAKASGLTKADGSAYTQQDIEDALRLASNMATGETTASNMIINPQTDTALGNNPTDPVASTNFDTGAVFTAGEGGSVVQVNRDGTPLGTKPVDPALVAYIKANTGGVNSPYVWVMPQPGTSNPNAGLNSITPAANGCVTAECAGGVAGVRNSVRDVNDIRNDVADGAAVVSRGSGIVGSTATAASTIPGPHQPGAATTAVVATGVGFTADVIEQIARPDVALSSENAFYMAIQMRVDSSLPIAAPITNEVINAWKNSNTNLELKEWANIEWRKFVDLRSKP